jgi:hypothetical protein
MVTRRPETLVIRDDDGQALGHEDGQDAELDRRAVGDLRRQGALVAKAGGAVGVGEDRARRDRRRRGRDDGRRDRDRAVLGGT